MAFLENMLKKRLRADVHLSTANSTPLSESPTSKAGTFLRSIASGSGSSGGKIGSLFHKDTSLQTLLDGDSKEKDAILQRSPPSAPPLSAPEEAQVASSPNADDVPFVATEEIDLLTSDTVEAFEQAFQQIVLESSAAVDSDDNHHVIDTDDAEHSDNGVVAGDLSEATDLESEMSDDGDMSNGGEETSARIEERSITSGGTPSTTRADDTPPETPRLQLEQQLKSIKQQMDIIRQQDALLTLMIDKAKRGGDNAQSSAAKTSLLKQIALLTKTKWQYEQELKTFDFQKTQLELQLDDGMIRPGRIAISIPSWAAGESSAMNATGIARPFVVFIIEATQIDDEEERKGAPSGSGWIVARRYSEFHTLHRRLKAAFPSIMGRYELPGKRFLANGKK